MKEILAFLLDEKIVTSVIILVLAIVVSRFSCFFIKKILNRGHSKDQKKRTTIMELFAKIIKFFIYAIAIMMILNKFGIDTNGILASLGIAGVVLGLALQDTAQDLMGGITIILDNYYSIGDYIKVNGFEGTVVDISLKSTKIKSVTGEIYTFANRNMSSVENYSQNDAGVLLEIPTAYEEETKKVEDALQEVIKESIKEKLIFDNSGYLGINSLDSSSINYAIIVYCKSANRWSTKRMMLKKIKEKYEEKNIKIPYNQIEVHNGKEI